MNYKNEIKIIKEQIVTLQEKINSIENNLNNNQDEKPFKVGDRVQFKTWEEMENEFGTNGNYIETSTVFTHEMKHLCGTYATIKEINGKSVKLCDFTENYGTTWCYSFDMLKHVENEPKWVFTEDEKAILRNIDEDYKYIARDKDNYLYVYIKKPEKYIVDWSTDDVKFKQFIFKDIFKCIQWTDEEPCEFRKYI